MKESDIRPLALFDRYLELSRRDIEAFFSNRSDFVEVSCPACHSSRAKLAFTKLGFEYQQCDDCSSLYLSPRPTEAAQAEYSRKSEAVKFWSTHFYRETADARRQKMFRPRAELVASIVRDRIPHAATFADVGAGYGIFLEEIGALALFDRVIGIEPAPDLAEICREKGFDVIEKMVEEIPAGGLRADFVTAFEVLEHVFSPVEFLRACQRTLAPGGLLLFTTLTSSGFDLQVLWDESKSIYPPHHINLLSIEGYRLLVESAGLELVELTTPGKLDVDIVTGALRERPLLDVPRFVKSLLDQSQEVLDRFQGFLQQSLLSSHVRVIARRPLTAG